MKRQFLLVVAIAAFATALTTNAYGQSGKNVRANLEFEFQIGDQIYPAGEYRIESLSGLSNILQIRSIDNETKRQLIVAIHSSEGKGEAPYLVFVKYGAKYFLTDIFLDSERSGYSIPPSRRQRKSERNLALASLETVEVRLGVKGNKK